MMRLHKASASSWEVKRSNMSYVWVWWLCTSSLNSFTSWSVTDTSASLSCSPLHRNIHFTLRADVCVSLDRLLFPPLTCPLTLHSLFIDERRVSQRSSAAMATRQQPTEDESFIHVYEKTKNGNAHELINHRDTTTWEQNLSGWKG